MKPSQEWDGGETADETTAIPAAASPEAVPAKTDVTEPQKVEALPKPIPRMPPHDPNNHTVTPTPKDSHQGVDSDLPQHKDQFRQQILAKSEPIPETYAELLREHHRLMQIFNLHHSKARVLPPDKFIETKFRMDVVCERLHKVQQGTPETPINSLTYGNQPHVQHGYVKRERLEILARQTPEIAELLAERDALATKAANWQMIAEGHLQSIAVLNEDYRRLHPKQLAEQGEVQ